MFFEMQSWKRESCRAGLSNNAVKTGFSGYSNDVLEQLLKEYGHGGAGVTSISAHVAANVPEDGYMISISEDEINVFHSNRRGLIYAVITLRQLLQGDELFCGVISDSPDCNFRGYRVYLPGRNSFQEFFDMIDTIVYYKYNYISFEIGGAMEYKRHPEINEKWLEFAADTHRYSGRTHEIQKGYAWNKNSIHTDNGEGDVLTQDEVRTLIDYCRYRGLEVYPEVPTLSHTDYICLAHPELAERKEDPYPDTYCPGNPEAYKIVFDILDEVIDVFNPKLINIGHDEFYSMCLCERCRGKRPQDVFTQDVTKIHDFLSARSITTCMWCDKLLPVVTKEGKTYGGAGHDRINERGEHICFPPTFQCQSMLPRDIVMINWYYSFGMQYDIMLHMHEYPMVFGNMAVSRVADWRLRRGLGLRGGSCSNWGSNHPDYMQRNCQYLNLISGAFALWSHDYDTTDLNSVMTRVFDEAYRLHFGNVKGGGYIEVTHTTAMNIKYKVFYDGIFIEDELYHMGKYVLTYDDGGTAQFEVVYGKNISCDSIPCQLGKDSASVDPTLSVAESALGEVCYCAIPRSVNGRTWYRTAFKNPHPEKKIRAFEYVPDNGQTVDIMGVSFYR